jgi:hypothetical protein
MEVFEKIEKHEQFNQHGELVCVNWYLEITGDAMVISTLPLTVVYAFISKQFPEIKDISQLDEAQTKAAFEAFNAYTTENCDRLKELFPECTSMEENTELAQYLIGFAERWLHNDKSIFSNSRNTFDFVQYQYDIYGLMIEGFHLMEELDYSDDFKFISRSEFEGTLGNQEQIDCYLDHYQLLKNPDVRFFSMYENDMNYHMPILDNKPVFILVEHKEAFSDAA